MADIFGVIADSTRREILGVLLERRASNGEASVSQIVDALGVPQPTISKHLRTLRDAGLVRVREDGQHRYYAIELRPLDEVDDWLMPFIFADDAQSKEVSLGSAAFAAWAGANVTTPLRTAAEQARVAAEQALASAEQALARATEVARHPESMGQSLGRRVAEGVHDVQGRLQEGRTRATHAIDEARERIDTARDKLRHAREREHDDR